MVNIPYIDQYRPIYHKPFGFPLVFLSGLDLWSPGELPKCLRKHREFMGKNLPNCLQAISINLCSYIFIYIYIYIFIYIYIHIYICIFIFIYIYTK